MKHPLSRTATVLLLLLACLSLAPLALAQERGEEEQSCFACHRALNLNGIEGTRVSITLCQDCHGDPLVDQKAAAGRTPVYVDSTRYRDTVHSEIACVGCHADVARNPHSGEVMACADCHAATLAHVSMGAPHMSTDCAACHLEALPATQEAATGRVLLAQADAGGAPINRTGHDLVAAPGCDKCHTSGNDVGAPAVTLPARSILCMACHDASPTISVALFHPAPVQTDYLSIVGLIILCVGMVSNVSLYLRGKIPGHPGLTAMQKLNYIAADSTRLIFSRRIFRFLGAAIADGIFLRRVLQESVGRWVIHTLIYLPFLLRFGLGLITWLGQLLWPSAAWTQTLSDKNTPGVALAYDFLTLLMLLGVLLAIVRRFFRRDRRLLTFTQDRVAIFLLGAIVLIGILTEGLRLLSANTPQDVAVYSFLGYGAAALLRWMNLSWTVIYPVFWYLHVLPVVILIAYLPFSKFMHIVAGPFIASLDAARKGSH